MKFARLLGQMVTVTAMVGLTAPASAYDASGVAKVAVIEVTYMPASILFQLDAMIGACQPGQWIHWNPQGGNQSAKDQNAQAVLAALMTAKSSSQSVRVFLTSSGCKAEYLYLS